MSRKAIACQADITRALRAAVAAGLNPVGCRIAPDGSIHVDLGGEAAKPSSNPLDSLLA